MKDYITCPDCKTEFIVDLIEGNVGKCPNCHKEYFIDSIGDSHEWCFPDWRGL